MQGWSLRFYMHENQRHGTRLLYEWLLEQARARGVPGASAFRAIAGFGRHGILSEQHFFELAGQSTVMLEFIVSQAQADALVELVRGQSPPVFHVRCAVEYDLSPTAQ